MFIWKRLETFDFDRISTGRISGYTRLETFRFSPNFVGDWPDIWFYLTRNL